MRIAILAVSLSLVLGSASALAAPKPCATPQQRQFDFWVGTWDVYPKTGPQTLVAHSLIESRYDGCAVRENWMPLSNAGGGSISSYDPLSKTWRQFWADSQGGSAFFSGSWNGKAMVLTGVWPQTGRPKQLTRMTYTRLTDGSVEQLGVTSDDNGKTWQPGFDYVYRKSRR